MKMKQMTLKESLGDFASKGFTISKINRGNAKPMRIRRKDFHLNLKKAA